MICYFSECKLAECKVTECQFGVLTFCDLAFSDFSQTLFGDFKYDYRPYFRRNDIEPTVMHAPSDDGAYIIRFA